MLIVEIAIRKILLPFLESLVQNTDNNPTNYKKNKESKAINNRYTIF